MYPSIFNDVIGPVMRGNSSSHTAAAVRIANFARKLVNDDVLALEVIYEEGKALAKTYDGHGSDVGIATGILGETTYYDGLCDSLSIAKDKGIDIKFTIGGITHDHPNAMKLVVTDSKQNTHSIVAVSVGGGAFEIEKIDDMDVCIKGDFWETLVFCSKSDAKQISAILDGNEEIVELNKASYEDGVLLEIKSSYELSATTKELISTNITDGKLITVPLIMPVASFTDYNFPFADFNELIEMINESDNASDVALIYESIRAGISKQEVYDRMKEIVLIIKKSMELGLKGTEYEKRLLGTQNTKIAQGVLSNTINDFGLVNNVTRYTMAMMEVKSSYGVIVAAPTGGSCGVLPGSLLAVAAETSLDDDTITRGFLAAGIIGTIIGKLSTFAGEVGGCQAECGSAASMSAAAITEMLGGNGKQSLSAAASSLQTLLGLACDPIANTVEAPCIFKNVTSALTALSSSQMALVNVDSVIPFVEVVEAHKEVGELMPPSICCTGAAGLSVTKTSKRLEIMMDKLRG